MKSITIRLNDEDLKILEYIKDKINKQWENIFGSETKTSTSEVIRAALHNYYDDLVL